MDAADGQDGRGVRKSPRCGLFLFGERECLRVEQRDDAAGRLSWALHWLVSIFTAGVGIVRNWNAP